MFSCSKSWRRLRSPSSPSPFYWIPIRQRVTDEDSDACISNSQLTFGHAPAPIRPFDVSLAHACTPRHGMIDTDAGLSVAAHNE